MSTTRKRSMIIGSSLLFSACGPGQNNSPDLPSTDSGATVPDSGAFVDAGISTADIGSIADTGPLLDTGPTPTDTGAPLSDTGAPGADVGAPADPPNNGVRCTDRNDAYCAAGQATFFCTGTHWQRTDNFDCDPCDGGNEFTGYSQTQCGYQPGAQCNHQSQAFCDENLRPDAICMTRWQSLENNDMCSPCEVDDQGYLRTMCAVPGFIGLHRAGQSRHPGHSLRRH